MRNVFSRLAGVVCAAMMAGLGCGGEDEPADGAGSGGTTSAGMGGGGGAATAPASGCTMTQGGTMVTGLCGAAALNALTPTEALQLCTDTGAFVAGAIERAVSCKYIAIVAAASNSSPTEAELQNACSSREAACNQDSTVMGAGAGTQCSSIPATCTATVEQYSACVVSEATSFGQGAAALTSCAMLTFGNLSTVYDVPMAAQSAPGCMALKTACPNFNLPYIN